MKDKTQENQELELNKKKKGIHRIAFKWIGKCLSL